MFRPNRTGKLYSWTGRDKHAREIFDEPKTIPLAIVKLKPLIHATTVRADSSASRGTADEIRVNGKILVPPHVSIKIDDRIELDGEIYRVLIVEPRYAVIGGRLDHYEVDLGAPPA